MYLDFTDQELKEIYPRYLAAAQEEIKSRRDTEVLETYIEFLVSATARITKCSVDKAFKSVARDIHQ